MGRDRLLIRIACLFGKLTSLALLPAGVLGQTISGHLLEARNERPIRLGIVELISMDGDTVGRAFSGDDGRFAVRAEEPGVFTLSASAYGYRTTVASGFELGRNGAMTVEVRMTADPVELDEMVVGFNRPMLDHPLVSNGFVERFRQGFGHFITPVDIERSPASVTTDLFPRIDGRDTPPPGPWPRQSRVWINP